MQIYRTLCFCANKAEPTEVDKTTVVAISIKKLTPITPKMRNAQIFG